MYDNQSAFDKAWAGLAAQGWRQSRHMGGECAYRGVGGRKCAVGHLIDDKFYDESMEGLICDMPIVCKALALSGINANRSFLYDMQKIHDYGRFLDPKLMELKFRKFAEQNGLTIPQQT